jgi:rSAM/selenodomain-associated transferase 1
VTRGWIVVFAKAPAAGRVKTRFSPPFTPAEAAAFYGCLLADVLEVTAQAAAALDLDAVLSVDPPDAAAALAAQAPAGVRAVAQHPGPLGERMTRAAHAAIAAGAPFVLLRGSDSPCLGEKTIRAAVEALDRADVVLCPDRDGGFNLVGLSARVSAREIAHFFDHPMSTPTVLRETLARAARAGRESHLLPPGFDLDRFDDLRQLAAERHADAAALCPRTIAFLDEHGLWPALQSHAG